METTNEEVKLPNEVQQVQIVLESGEELIYFGEAQVELGDTISVVDINFSKPMPIVQGWELGTATREAEDDEDEEE